MTVLDGQRSTLKDMVILAINTELRLAEVLNLKPEHVDFHRDVLYIKSTKTDEDREVPLNSVSRELLAKLFSRAQRQGDEYLLTNSQTKTKYTSVKTAWFYACKKAQITT